MSGPSLQDFINDPNPEVKQDAEEWIDYEGKLKREKGEEQRLR